MSDFLSSVGLFLVGAVIFVGFFVGIALGARRLLGLRVGRVRLLLAGGVGWVAGSVFVNLVGQPERQGMLVTVVIGTAVFVAMLFLVAAEVVLPAGSNPVGWTMGARHTVQRLRRYLQIALIIRRHRLLTPRVLGRDRRAAADLARERARHARSLREALEECGVTLVKLGQALSMRYDLLPQEYTTELSRLHDQVPPEPWPEIERVLTEDLGAPPTAVFAEFDVEPLAAASIAQVHAARLHNGEAVVVKVLRPGVRRVVENDLNIVRRLARTLEARTHWGRTIGSVALADGFSVALREELDFRIEARNIVAIGMTSAMSDTDPKVRLPAVYEPLCTARVLVMERLIGAPIGLAEPVVAEHGLDRRELAVNLLGCVLQQILFDGVFHCDPHPGNVLVLADGRLGLLDFGVVGRLDPVTRAAMQQLLLAIERGDRGGLCDALLEVVERPDDLDEVALERAIGRLMARYLSPGTTPGVEMFAALFRLVAAFDLKVPPEAAAVFRALTTLEGTLAALSPGFRMVEEVRGYALAHRTHGMSYDQIKERGVNEFLALIPMLRRLPRRVDRILTALDQGRLTLSIRPLAHERDRRHLTSLVQLGLLTFLAATTGITAALLLSATDGPMVTPGVSLMHVLGYNFLVVSAVLTLRVLVRTFRRDL